MAPHAVDSRWPPICLLAPQCAGAHNNAWMSFCMQGIEREGLLSPVQGGPWVTTKGPVSLSAGDQDHEVG